LPSYAQEMIVGPIIVVAVAIDRWRAGRDEA
jgi:ribose/xylose/arabinose/galactoside ABC-type transport system permease subunit